MLLASAPEACNAALQMQRMEPIVKTANFPSLRVAPELREAAESVLESGESLSSFVAESVTLQIRQRRAQRDFIERGLASRDAALQSGEYYSADDILRDLDEVIAEAEAPVAK
ncbi:YlcI/YnfO family protein [Massilia scottii]|uniref:YlcI/YnfO family protein n=1 Tax=Massilia scottii TaxID=3057166 RepID=UPI002796AE82|nr:YlcI/YnfO family protein [Massilia sp. CCM 9029]MDQ1829933.1 YlcI/YnfO family protein [Massilia sp. CCM 9029]